MNIETAKASSEESKRYASNKEYQTTTFEMNVKDQGSVQAMVDFVVKEFGRLDYAVNAAGVSDSYIISNQSSFPELELAGTHCLTRLTMAFTLPLPRPTSTTLTASCISIPAAI